MLGPGKIASLLTAALLLAPAVTQAQRPEWRARQQQRQERRQQRKQQAQAAEHPAQNPPGHAGYWLRRYRDLPPDQQRRELENDPQFKKLPPPRQAQLQNRRVDAMAFYENALLTRLDAQQKPETGMKDELADNARQLWAGLGGSDEGWKLWYGRRADALANMATLTWEDANQPLATFELADLSGKTWDLAALKGKTTFLNFWASW